MRVRKGPRLEFKCHQDEETGVYLLAHRPELAVRVVQESQRRVVLGHLPRIQHQHPVIERHGVKPTERVTSAQQRTNEDKRQHMSEQENIFESACPCRGPRKNLMFSQDTGSCFCRKIIAIIALPAHV